MGSPALQPGQQVHRRTQYPCHRAPRHPPLLQYLLLQNHANSAAKEMQTRYNELISDERVARIVAKSSYCAPLTYENDKRYYESGIGNNAACPTTRMTTAL